jgi:hypothetical protein
MFTTNVPVGNVSPYLLAVQSDSQYRIKVPAKPANPIKINLSIL